nr:MAG TPA: hypothetical protein [Caudoviricetes sp.]
MTESRSNLQKYAMHFGTYMGVYWILKFILFPLEPQTAQKAPIRNGRSFCCLLSISNLTTLLFY